MNMRKALVVAATLLWAVASSALPASGAPSGTTITVYQHPCEQSECGSGDAQVANNGEARNVIQIKAHSTSSAGLTSVQVDLRYNDGGWVCTRKWSTSSGNFNSYVNWNTDAYPGDADTAPAGCPVSSANGAATRNGAYDIRVVATDPLGTQTATIQVLVNNKPSVPTWADDPVASGDLDRNSNVELRWDANPEPDVVEYHFVRTDPDGGQREYAVSATRPGGQGCEREGAWYICNDDDFPTDAYKGEYTYTLVALRASPTDNVPCSLTTGNCVASSTSDAGSVTLREPEDPTPEPTDSGGSGSGGGGTGSGSGGGTKTSGTKSTRGSGSTAGVSGATYCDFFCGEYKKSLPYTPGHALLPGGSSGGRPIYAAGPSLGSGIPIEDDGTGRLPRSLAGGLLLLLCASHMARALRRHA
jgi:hypothetical protein